MARENAAVFSLDCPNPPLVVHLRSRVLPNAPYQFRVSANLTRSLRRRHCCYLRPTQTLILAGAAEEIKYLYYLYDYLVGLPLNLNMKS